MTRWWLRVGLLLALVLTMALGVLRPPSGVYPSIEIQVPDPQTPITIRTVFEKQAAVADCELLTGNIVRVTLERCPNCRIVTSRCDSRQSTEGAKLLGSDPVPYPSGLIRNGALAFVSQDATAAQQACDAAAVTTANSKNPLICTPALQPRTSEAMRPPISDLGLLAPIAAGVAAWLVGWFIIRYEHLHAHLTHDAVASGPQKTHARPTPRIGGVQIMAGLLAGWLILSAGISDTGRELTGLVLLCAMPAFLGGLVEDVTKKVGVVERLLMTMLSGALGCWLLGAVVQRVDIAFLDLILSWLPLGVAFTCIAAAGVANSINIIDGFHGLASGITIITASALAYAAWALGDSEMFSISLLLAGATMGFFIWNWPRGLIFLGDGGAYSIGAILASTSILLVARNPGISAWFPLLLLSHPIIETLFSIGRRLFTPSATIGSADSDHLHQLVYRRLYGNNPSATKHNHRVAKYFWLACGVTCTTGAVYSSTPQVLMLLAATYLFFYTFAYIKATP